MRRSVLIQELIGLYPTVIRAMVCLCHRNEVPYAVVSQRCTFCVCVVLLPCLCCVIGNKDALGISVYTYLLQPFLSRVYYWLLGDIVDYSHIIPPALRYHTHQCTAYRYKVVYRR